MKRKVKKKKEFAIWNILAYVSSRTRKNQAEEDRILFFSFIISFLFSFPLFCFVGMFFSAVLRTSRTTYRGSSGSGRGASAKTSFRSSPASRSTLLPSVLAGHNFKRAQRGLFDGALPQSGNTIPKSRQKTARTWRPNIQSKHVFSEILHLAVKAKITTRALRTIRKYGGLDSYLAQRDDKILGEWGRSLRSRVASQVQSNQGLKQVHLAEMEDTERRKQTA